MQPCIVLRILNTAPQATFKAMSVSRATAFPIFWVCKCRLGPRQVLEQKPHKAQLPELIRHIHPGLRHIDVKPSDKDPYQGDKVTILLPLHSDSIAKRDVPEITQTDFSEFKSRVGDGAMFVGACGAALRSDCVPQASSRLSDSGIESESSSATQLAPVSPSPFANTCLEALTEPILPSAHQSPASRGANTLEGLNPESTSGISEVQSSLTSINSLPSDDEVDSEVTSRKSSILVQEQSLIFSGETHSLPLSSSRVLAQQKATISHGDGLVSYNEDSAIQPRCETNAPERPQNLVRPMFQVVQLRGQKHVVSLRRLPSPVHRSQAARTRWRKALWRTTLAPVPALMYRDQPIGNCSCNAGDSNLPQC